MSWFGPSLEKEAAEIKRIRTTLADADLRQRFRDTDNLLEGIAIVAAVAARTLGMEMFDVQLQGALVLARGGIAEMQTGEGKTPACRGADQRDRSFPARRHLDLSHHRPAFWHRNRTRDPRFGADGEEGLSQSATVARWINLVTS